MNYNAGNAEASVHTNSEQYSNMKTLKSKEEYSFDNLEAMKNIEITTKKNENEFNTMKRIKIGILGGLLAGIIDVIPMILQKLTWDANLSAFSLWAIVGFFISVVEIKINPILKGLLVAFLVLCPCAILIAWQEPFSLIPISIMTLILGGLLGFGIEKIKKRSKIIAQNEISRK